MGNRGRHPSTARARFPFLMPVDVYEPVTGYSTGYQGNFPAVDLQPILVVAVQVVPVYVRIHCEIVAGSVSQAATPFLECLALHRNTVNPKNTRMGRPALPAPMGPIDQRQA